jgi:DNA-binding transcriptional LysR family regulator
MAEIELRDLRLFLTLAEELHFGRTADRLGITTSRASQTLAALERKLGGRRLFDRTSRVVTLTVAGEDLREELRPALAALDGALDRARVRSAGPGVVRIGVLNAASGQAVLTRAIQRFEASYDGATVRLWSTQFKDTLGLLRRGEVDLTVTRLPLEQADIEVGPLLSEGDPRVLMVAADHPLAERGQATLEDLADYPVRRPAGVPAELVEAGCPSRTPSGRPIVAADVEVNDVSELILLIAQGRLVHPTVAPFAEHFQHPGITVLPLRGLPPSPCALAWLRGREDAGRDAFVRMVLEVSADA